MIVYRKRLPVAVGVVIVAFVLAGAASLARYARLQQMHRCWGEVRDGMSKDQVRQLCGPPAFTYGRRPDYRPHTWRQSVTVIQETWAYGDRGLALSQRYPYLWSAYDDLPFPKDGDHVVYFDAAGRVVEKKYPYKRPQLISPWD